MYCYECIHWEPENPEIGFCSHQQSNAFQEYADACLTAEVKIDAQDCAGFELEIEVKA
jgi:hypothetical protein